MLTTSFFTCVSFIIIFSSGVLAQDSFRPAPVKIVQIKGNAQLFSLTDKKIKKAAVGDFISTGQLLATGNNSMVLIDPSTNGIIFVGANTRLVPGPRSKTGIRQIDLLKGKVYFKTKPEFGSRPPGVIFTTRGSSTAYLGEEFELEYTNSRKELKVVKGEIKKFRLKRKGMSAPKQALASANEDDSWDEDPDDVTDLPPTESSLTEASDSWDEDPDSVSMEPAVTAATAINLASDDDSWDEDVDDLSSDNKNLSSTEKNELAVIKEENTDEIAFDREKTEEYINLLQRRKEDALKKKDPATIKIVKRGYTIEANVRVIRNLEEVDASNNQLSIIDNDGTEQNIENELVQDPWDYDARLEIRGEKNLGKSFVHFHGWVEYGQDSDKYREVSDIFNEREDGRGVIVLNELYFQNNWTNADLTIGKKVFKTGVAFLYSPMDRVTPKDSYDPLDTKDLGNYMFQVDYYIGSLRMTYALIPYFLPNQTGRTLITTAEEQRIRPKQIYPDGSLDNFTNYAQVKGTLAGFDYIFGLFYGPQTYPVYFQDIDKSALEIGFFKEQINVFAPAFGITTVWGPSNLYFEYVYQDPRAQNDDTYGQTLLGIKYKLDWLPKLLRLDEMDIILEYSKEKIFQGQESVQSADPTDLILNPDNVPGGKNFIQSSINFRTRRDNLSQRTTFKFNDKYTATYNFDLNFFDGSKLFVYGLEYRANPNLKFFLNYESYSIDLERQNEQASNNPFGLDIATDDTTASAKQKFDRYTLRMLYTF